MTPPEGWRVVSTISRAPSDLLSQFRGLGSGPVCDALGRFAAMDYQIKSLDPSMQMVGSALTVWTRPCDNLAIYKALEMSQPDDVLVIAVHGYTTNSVWGELTTLIAQTQGLGGMVTDGMVRDSQEIIDIGLPVFARGLSPNSPLKDGPGKINVPVTCGGIGIRPGDIVVGDADGVVVVPQQEAEAVLERVAAIHAKEATIRAEIQGGQRVPSQMARLLRDKGV